MTIQNMIKIVLTLRILKENTFMKSLKQVFERENVNFIVINRFDLKFLFLLIFIHEKK